MTRLHHSDRQRIRLILYFIGRFVRKYDAWPSVDEMVQNLSKYHVGGTNTVGRLVRLARDGGLVMLIGGAREAGWMLTPSGWDHIGRVPYVPNLARRVPRLHRSDPAHTGAYRRWKRRQLRQDAAKIHEQRQSSVTLPLTALPTGEHVEVCE